jgi:hypothetical protein
LKSISIYLSLNKLMNAIFSRYTPSSTDAINKYISERDKQIQIIISKLNGKWADEHGKFDGNIKIAKLSRDLWSKDFSSNCDAYNFNSRLETALIDFAKQDPEYIFTFYPIDDWIGISLGMTFHRKYDANGNLFFVKSDTKSFDLINTSITNKKESV